MRFMKPMFLLMCILCTFAFSQSDTGHYYLMSYFRGDYPGVGDKAGAFFATSTDGITWTELNKGKPVLTPAGIDEGRVRDPFLFFDRITQMFHLVYTTGWNTTNIGYTSIVPTDGKSFTDQNNWAEQVALPIGKDVTGTVCSWAPEIFYDDIQNKYMIYLSIDVNVDGKRAYYVLTSDFKTFTKAAKFFDPGFTEIDGDLLKVADHNYYFFFKDERDGYKRIYYVTGSTPQGTWSGVSANSITSSALPGVEGPSSIKIGNEYRVYFDPYNARQSYRMVKSTDLTTWKEGGLIRPITDTTTYFDYSHCNVIEIPKNIYDWINTAKLPVRWNPKTFTPSLGGVNRFEVPGIYSITGKRLCSQSFSGVNTVSNLPAGFFVAVDKTKKVGNHVQATR